MAILKKFLFNNFTNIYKIIKHSKKYFIKSKKDIKRKTNSQQLFRVYERKKERKKEEINNKSISPRKTKHIIQKGLKIYYSMIIFIIICILLSLVGNHRKIISNQSSITLKFKQVGKNKLFFSGYDSKCGSINTFPDIVYINGIE